MIEETAVRVEINAARFASQSIFDILRLTVQAMSSQNYGQQSLSALNRQERPLASVDVNSHTLLSGAARHCGELPQILPRSCLAGRGAVSGHRLLSGTGRFAGHRWQHHGASVGNAGAVGDPAGGSVYERKVHESHYQCNDLIPFGD